MKKVTAIIGGCDWTDASVEYLVVNEDVNLKEKNKEYKEQWYWKEYFPVLKTENKIPFMDFAEWLINKGFARNTTDDELEEYYEL